MVGSLKYLSEKKWDLKKFENILKSKDRKNCAPLAPAHGLYLEKLCINFSVSHCKFFINSPSRFCPNYVSTAVF